MALQNFDQLNSMATKWFSKVDVSEEEKKKQEAKAFLQFVIAIEKEKVYYFILAKTTPNPVVIVKSPSGTTNIKKIPRI